MTWQSEEHLTSDAGAAQQQRGGEAIPLVFDSVETAEGLGKETSKANEDLLRAQFDLELQNKLEEQRELIKVQMAEMQESVFSDERARLEREYIRSISDEHAKIARLSERFNKETKHYFMKIEEEVVKLSLAVAARVLHREVNLDPIMLRGVVQIALKQIHEKSNIVIQVPKPDFKLWNELFKNSEDNFAVKLEADEKMNTGECVLRSDIGTVNLGVEAQLVEIEHGFFDLLKHRTV